MTELEIHQIAAWSEIGLAAITAGLVLFISAPYGRHGRGGWGPEIPARLGWVLMELPACLGFAAIFAAGANATALVPLLLFALWQSHYVYRTFVFPFRIRAAGKTWPLSIALLAVVFNSLNAYVNARWIGHLGEYGTAWLSDPRLWIGAAVFFVGMAINHQADAILRGLRKPGESGYKIPTGGLYRYVSCPNYLGEMIEWIGWAIATWSLGGLAFALYTMANLGPRAMDHHRWYRKQFDDYPAERKALIPFVL